MKLKKGVKCHALTSQVVLALVIAGKLYQEMFSKDMVVTSLHDGKHSSGSLHYSGNAFDMRTWGIVDDDLTKYKAALNSRLGVDFDVVIESDHIHVEYQPKTR